MPLPSYVIFLNGGYGVGKSSTLDHLGDLLAETGTAFSLFDVDWFHRSWPPAANDPDNVLIEADNMAVVWNNYSLRWHLDRQVKLTEEQTKADLDEFVIATDERIPRSVAEETLSHFGLR